MQTKVKSAKFPYIKGILKTKAQGIVTKTISLHHKINRNAQDSPDNFVNSCYLHSAIIGKDTFQKERTLPQHPRERKQSHA